MTDDRRPTAAPEDSSQRRSARRIPALVWIVIFLLVAWFAWAWVQRGGHDTTPSGGTAPAASQGTTDMPAAPANGGAPATPASQGSR